MEINKRTEIAVEYKRKNNCAQSVLLAFQPEIGMDDVVLKAVGSGFGTGMGGMEATCGALCEAAMAAGFINKSGTPTKAIAREMLQEFKEVSGATVCGDLKGIKTGKMLFSCDDCIRLAVSVLEKRLAALK